MSEYLVSVAIPTYNRQKYAESTIRQVYNLGEQVQVVISDNSTDNSLGEMINDICDNDRVKYIYTEKKMSVVDNYNTAAMNSDGDYFISIGDDDIVLKIVIDLARWMKKNDVDAVRSSRCSVYSWPSEDKISNGLLSLGPFSGSIRIIDPLDATIKTLGMGCQSYMELDMVGTYHEIASKQIMDRAYSICGYYYSGFSPDIYSSTVISLVPDIKAYRWDYPISIPGFCPDSATFRGKKGTASSTVEEAIKKYGKPGYVWDSRVPRYYIPQTTWAVTMLQALVDMGREELIDMYYDKSYLINACYNSNGGSYREELIRYFTDDEKSLIDKDLDTSFTENDKSIIGAFSRKVSTVFHLMSKDKFRRDNVLDSQTAADLANEFLNTAKMKNRVSFLYAEKEEIGCQWN